MITNMPHKTAQTMRDARCRPSATSAATFIRMNALRKESRLWSCTDHLTPTVIGKSVTARITLKLRSQFFPMQIVCSHMQFQEHRMRRKKAGRKFEDSTAPNAEKRRSSGTTETINKRSRTSRRWRRRTSRLIKFGLVSGAPLL